MITTHNKILFSILLNHPNNNLITLNIKYQIFSRSEKYCLVYQGNSNFFGISRSEKCEIVKENKNRIRKHFLNINKKKMQFPYTCMVRNQKKPYSKRNTKDGEESQCSHLHTN